MDRDSAIKVLGVPQTAGIPEIKEAYEKQKAMLEAGFMRAQNDAAKDQYRTQIEELNAAWVAAGEKQMVLTMSPVGFGGGHDTPLTATQLADLPSITPFSTLSDVDSEPGVSAPIVPGIPLKVGQKLSGRYEIRRFMAQGGMGAVFAAYDEVRKEEKALKVMQPYLVRNSAARERFYAEAKISSNLSHPNIANVHDVQQDGDYCFLTMELLKGRTLREEMKLRQEVNKPFEVAEVLKIIGPICDALSYAHGLTVHRDIKPENIWVGKDGVVKLMDFGIARLKAGSNLTQTMSVLGTLDYMAPEQRDAAREVDHRADQYSLAVVAYELLSGTTPSGRAKSIAELRPDAPLTLSKAIDKALQTNPNDRFADVNEFYSSLSRKGRSATSKKRMVTIGAACALVVVVAYLATNQSVRLTAKKFITKPAVPVLAGAAAKSQSKVELEFELKTPELLESAVLRRQEGNQPWTDLKLQDLKQVGTERTKILDPDELKAGTTYKYQLASIGKAGESLSEVVEVTTFAPLPKPLAFDTPAPGPDKTRSIQLSWSGEIPKGAELIVERSVDGSNWTRLEIPAKQAALGQFKDDNNGTGLDPGTQYTYQAKLITANNEVVPSADKKLQVSTVPAPLDFSTAVAEDPLKVVLSWKTPLKNDWKLFIQKDDGTPQQFSPEQVLGNTWTDTAALPNKAHKYSVFVANAGGQSEIVTKSAITPPAQPLAPEITEVTPAKDGSSVKLKFRPGNANKIQILRKEASQDQFAVLEESLPGTATDYTDRKNVERRKAYEYKVVAVATPLDPNMPAKMSESSATDAVIPLAERPRDVKLKVASLPDQQAFRAIWSDLPDGIHKIVFLRAQKGETAQEAATIDPATTNQWMDSFKMEPNVEYEYFAHAFHIDHPSDPLLLGPFPAGFKVKTETKTTEAGGAGKGGAGTVTRSETTVKPARVTPAVFTPYEPTNMMKALSTPVPLPGGNK